MSTETPTASPDAVLDATRNWLEKAVIGLNLCPFAKAVHVKKQIRYTVCEAVSPAELMDTLVAEMQLLCATGPDQIDTTLLIHPRVLGDFLDFNDFLFAANDELEALGLEGTLQLASFHPAYQFAGTEPDDLENFTNRSPFPILHLLREASVDRAVQAFPEAEDIYEKNIQTLEKLGRAGWRRLFPD